MTTRSGQFRDENLTLSFYLVGPMSQSTAPVDVAHKILGSSGDRYNIPILPAQTYRISRQANRPNLRPNQKR